MLTAMIRTAILYLLLILGLRLTGKRQIGELEPGELVPAMLLSDLASVPMQDFNIPLLHGVVPIVTLLSLSTLLSYASLRSVRLRRLICGEAALLISEGRLLQGAMRRNRLTLDELTEELRAQGVTDVGQVKYAVLETSGRLSVLLYPARAPVTPEQLGLAVADDLSLPRAVISDGRVLADNLRRAGKDEAWLREQLKDHGARQAGDVFLLTVDDRGAVTCLLREGRS
jgi:uncharacterized membrane protein YcaP (DUF421 family)